MVRQLHKTVLLASLLIAGTSVWAAQGDAQRMKAVQTAYADGEGSSADYQAGADVTGFIKNAAFNNGYNDWQNLIQLSIGNPVEVGDTVYYVPVANLDKALNVYQTIQLPKKGYYAFMMNGAYIPADDVYSYSHAAKIYANGAGVFLPTVREAMVSAAEAADGVNCNLTGGDPDFPIFSEPGNENSTLLGYAMHSRLSMALAISGGRLVNTVIAEVGDDGQLTLGITNPHGYCITNEWMSFGNARLIYLGEDLMMGKQAYTSVMQALQGYMDRAATIQQNYVGQPATGNYKEAPNYSNALKEELATLTAQGESLVRGDDTDAQYALTKKFSDLFDRIYQGRIAYAGMLNRAASVESVMGVLSGVLSREQLSALNEGIQQARSHYAQGDFSTEQADALLADMSEMGLELTQVDGVYQISTMIQMFLFASKVNGGEADACAVLLNDIDMGGKLLADGTPDPAGILFTPIGTGSGVAYQGTFDGQGHTLKNLVISSEDEYVGLFGCVGNDATIKNFVVDKNSYIGGKAFVGVIGASRTDYANHIFIDQIGMEGTVKAQAQNAGGIYGCNMNSYAFAYISNCYVTGRVSGARESAQFSGWAANCYVTNCWAIGDVSGVDGTNYFMRGATRQNENNYSNKGQSGINSISSTDLSSGKLTYDLNLGRTRDIAWTQDLSSDAHPVLFGTAVVYKLNDTYTNDEQHVELNAFAYAIGAEATAEDVTVTYALNSPARNAKINFKSGETVVYTHQLTGGDLETGRHSVTISNAQLPVVGTLLTFDIEVESWGIQEPVQMLAPTTSGIYSIYNAHGLAVNNCPESAGFGDIYLCESDNGSRGEKYISYNKHSALFVFDPEFNQVNAADGQPGFRGGLDMDKGATVFVAGNRGGYSAIGVAASADGRLFVGMSNNNFCPIYEANPENLDEPWTPLFTGGERNAQNGALYIGEEIQAGMTTALATEGQGESLKLTALAAARLNPDHLNENFFASTYNLGTAKEWSTTPSGQIEPLFHAWIVGSDDRAGIASDGRGGLWFAQPMWGSTNPNGSYPCLAHINAEGEVDYKETKNQQHTSTVAVSPDGNTIAVATGGKVITVYEVNYAPGADGQIVLTEKYHFTANVSYQTHLAFDYAGNLYAASAYSEVFTRFALPSFTDNLTVTPAPGKAAFKVGGLDIQDVEAGTATDGQIYTLGGIRIEKPQKGVNIMNGKKVLVK